MELLSQAELVPLLPLLAAALLAAVPQRQAAAWINLAAAAATFALACRLPWQFGTRRLLLVDAPAAHMAILAAFVALVAAWFSRAEAHGRLHQVLFQVLLGLTLFSLLSGNPAVTWIGIEATVIVAAVAIGLKLTPAAVAAAWRYLIVASAGLALALFGTVALYLAPVADGKVLNLVFVLLVLGYGTVAVLAPMQTWLPGAMQLPPLLVILRVRGLLAGHPEALAPGPLLLALGLAALLLAAAAMRRQQDVTHSFALAGIGQTGVAIFAVGLGSAAAVFSGLLHLTLLTLTRTALLQCARHADRRRGVTLMAAAVAMAGLPPFGLFASLFLVVMATVGTVPWLALPLGAGVIVLAWALVAKTVELDAGAPDTIALAPAWLLLVVAVVLGIAMPGPMVAWFTAVAAALR